MTARLAGVLMVMAACGGNPDTPKALVERTLAALDEGDRGGVMKIMVPTRMLRAYVDCDGTSRYSEDERWKLYDAYRDGGVEAAAAALKGKGVTLATCPAQFEEVKSFARGDAHDDDCKVRMPFRSQTVTFECYRGDQEVRLSLHLVELAGRWWGAWLREGRGYNN